MPMIFVNRVDCGRQRLTFVHRINEMLRPSLPWSRVSRGVAVVQRLAYASVDGSKFKASWEAMPSCVAARNLVRSLVQEGNKLVVVARASNFFGFRVADQRSGLVVFEPRSTEPRRCDLRVHLPAGRAILERLL